MFIHIVCGTIIFVLNIVYSSFAGDDDDEGGGGSTVVVENELAHTEFGAGMYYFAGASWGIGLVAVLLFGIFFFLPGINRYIFMVYRVIRHIH